MSACTPACGYCGRCTAAWERENDERGDIFEQEPVSVRVERRKDGYQGETFLNCTADCFKRGVLTITSVLTDTELRVFSPSEWLDAVAYDANGNVLFDIINPVQE